MWVKNKDLWWHTACMRVCVRKEWSDSPSIYRCVSSGLQVNLVGHVMLTKGIWSALVVGSKDAPTRVVNISARVGSISDNRSICTALIEVKWIHEWGLYDYCWYCLTPMLICVAGWEDGESCLVQCICWWHGSRSVHGILWIGDSTSLPTTLLQLTTSSPYRCIYVVWRYSYRMSKAALNMFTKSLGIEGKRWVDLIAFCLGLIAVG